MSKTNFNPKCSTFTDMELYSRQKHVERSSQQSSLTKLPETNLMTSSSMQNLIDYADERRLDVQTKRLLRKYKERKQQEAKKHHLVRSLILIFFYSFEA